MSDTKPRRQPITMFGLGQRCCDWRLQPETTFCGTFTTSDADVETLREIDMAGNQALYGVGVPAPRPTAPEEGLLAPGEIVEERLEGYVNSPYLREEMTHRHTDDFLRDGVWSHCLDAADALVVFRRGFTAENGVWKRGAEPKRCWRTRRATFESVVGPDVEGATFGEIVASSVLSLNSADHNGYIGARFGITATRRFELPILPSTFRVAAPDAPFVFPLGLAGVETGEVAASTDFETDSDILPPFQEGSNHYRTPPEILTATINGRSIQFEKVLVFLTLLEVENAPTYSTQETFADGATFADARIVGTLRAGVVFYSSNSGILYRRGDSLDPADYVWTPTVEEIAATLEEYAAPWFAALFNAARVNLEARWSVAVERSDMTIGDANGEPFPDDAIAAEVRARLVAR